MLARIEARRADSREEIASQLAHLSSHGVFMLWFEGMLINGGFQRLGVLEQENPVDGLAVGLDWFVRLRGLTVAGRRTVHSTVPVIRRRPRRGPRFGVRNSERSIRCAWPFMTAAAFA